MLYIDFPSICIHRCCSFFTLFHDGPYVDAPILSTISNHNSIGGNQRDLAREKNQKKQAAASKGKHDEPFAKRKEAYAYFLKLFFF